MVKKTSIQVETEHRWLDADEAARYLRITKRALYDRAARGCLPVHRFGKSLRFRLDELNAVMQPAVR
ncbi:MAG: helix-turn-helix domain-containing protein [Deltaproteobacteria bacterium]|nr:helix-turn-helix domain-containing protein [Deltaproteobacteria bacterium]